MNRTRSRPRSLSLDYKRGRRRGTTAKMARRHRRRPIPRRGRRRRPQKGGLLPLIALGLAAGLAYKKERKNYKKRARTLPRSINMPRNVRRRRTRSKRQHRKRTWLKKWGTTMLRGRGVLEAALNGIELGKSKKYKRMWAVGARGHY